VFLTFESRNWAEELAAFYRTDVDVPATVVVDGKTYGFIDRRRAYLLSGR
jgi:hypothetical protein